MRDAIERLRQIVHEAVNIAGELNSEPRDAPRRDWTQRNERNELERALLGLANDADEIVDTFHATSELGASAHAVGSIATELEAGGNLRIAKTHTPSESIIIEHADIDDLLVALDAALQQRASPVMTKDLTPSWFVEALQAFAISMLENTASKKPIDRVLVREEVALQLGIPPGGSVRFATAGGPVEVQSYNGNPFRRAGYR